MHLDNYSDPDSPTETVRESLLKKAPISNLTKQAFIFNTTNELHSIYFDMTDGQLIQSTARRTEGSALSGLDVAAWKRHLSSQHPQIYMKLLQPQSDVSTPALSTHRACLRLSLAVLYHRQVPWSTAYWYRRDR